MANAKHYIITNRETSNLEASNFVQVNANEYLRIDGCEEAQDSLRYGTVTFDPRKAKKLSDFKIYLHPDLSIKGFEKLYETGKPPKGKALASTKVFSELYDKGKKADTDREHTLVFIHGFKSDLEVAMQTMAQLHRRFVENPHCPVQNIVMFTWPAMCKIPKPLYKVIDLGERVHVYYHNGDKAPGVSEKTKNAFNRLGRWGAKNTIGLPGDVYQADVSDIRDDDKLINKVVHHWYYYNSDSVAEDIGVVLAGGNSVFTF